jgi:hypothetical protein
MTLLVFPYPLFCFEAPHQDIKAYSDRSISTALLSELDDVQRRLIASN